MTKATSDSVIIEMLNTIGRQDGRDEDKKRKTVRQMEKGEKLRKRRKARSDAAGSSDRGGTAASSAMRAEMKGINALNLEPALPNLDDKAPAQKCDADAILGNQNDATKREFQQSLEIIQQRTASKAAKHMDGEMQAMEATAPLWRTSSVEEWFKSLAQTPRLLQSRMMAPW